MGSDWIHHGEESYPEAAWLQLEVLIIAHRGLTCYDTKITMISCMGWLNSPSHFHFWKRKQLEANRKKCRIPCSIISSSWLYAIFFFSVENRQGQWSCLSKNLFVLVLNDLFWYSSRINMVQLKVLLPRGSPFQYSFPFIATRILLNIFIPIILIFIVNAMPPWSFDHATPIIRSWHPNHFHH